MHAHASQHEIASAKVEITESIAEQFELENISLRLMAEICWLTSERQERKSLSRCNQMALIYGTKRN